MTKLTDTQRIILSAAAQHEMGLARPPISLPAAARNAVFRSLIKTNLLTEINAPREHVGLGWRQDEDGTWIVARITDEGLRAIGIDPNEGDAVADTAPTVAPAAEPSTQEANSDEAAQPAPLTEELAMLDQALAAPIATPRTSLRDAAAAILAAWDARRAAELVGPRRRHVRANVEERFELAAIGGLVAGQVKVERQAVEVALDVDLVAEAAA